MKWKKLKSTKLFEHSRISIYEDDVELPSGSHTKYLHFGNMPDSAMTIALNEEGKFLVQKEYSYPPDEILYQLPGGQVNKGEDPEHGARRELMEETGLDGDLKQLGWFYLHNRRTKQRMFVYLATNLRKAFAEKDPEELFEEYWLTESEIDKLITTNEVRNYTLLAGWALYKNKLASK